MNFGDWAYFKINDIFEISKYGDVENVRVLKEGKTNYISTTAFNNGLSRKVTNTKYKVETGNCITVGIDGSFKSFYQSENFIRTTNIAVLRNEKLNKYNALFLVTVLDKAISKYYYGIKLKQTDELENTKLFLPSKDKNVNWDFMTSYMKNIYDRESANYVTKNKGGEVLSFAKWRTIKLVEYFDYERGQRYKKEDHDAGPYEYISSTEYNNGVDNYVRKKGRSKIYENALTIANSGSVGKVFYHPNKFIASDHVHVLTLKSKKPLTLGFALFLIPIIEKNACRFLFNKEITERTIGEIELSLPFNGDEIDYDYIENYMRQLPNFDLIATNKK